MDAGPRRASEIEQLLTVGKPPDRGSRPKMKHANRIYLTCPECNTRLREDRMRGHLQGMHGWSAEQSYRAHKIWLQRQIAANESGAEDRGSSRTGAVLVEKLPFELLPPGSWDVDQIIEHYRQESDHFPTDLRSRRIQWDRLKAVGSLKPVRCYIGTELWLGYVLFEFMHSARVVLECPVEGNATYIISGEWKGIVAYSKSHLRHNFPHRSTKIVHKGDWISRVKQALVP